MLRQQIMLTVLTGCLLLLAGAPAWMVPDDFTWTGQANVNGNWIPNWDEDGNWSGTGWPDEDQDDRVFINDTVPQSVVVQNVDVVPILLYLYIGDGHTVTLSHNLSVEGVNGVQAYTELEGAVVLQGDGSITSNIVRIYNHQDTSVTFAADYGGQLATN